MGVPRKTVPGQVVHVQAHGDFRNPIQEINVHSAIKVHRTSISVLLGYNRSIAHSTQIIGKAGSHRGQQLQGLGKLGGVVVEGHGRLGSLATETYILHIS